MEYSSRLYSDLFSGKWARVLDLFNPVKPYQYVLDKRFPGGSANFVRVIGSPETKKRLLRSAAEILVTRETITELERGNYQYALSRGSGEVVGSLISLEAVGRLLALAPKVGVALSDAATFINKTHTSPQMLEIAAVIKQTIGSTQTIRNDKIGKIAQQIEEFVGTDARRIPTQDGDLVLISKDGSRQVRFDIKNPGMNGAKRDIPHAHLRMKKGTKWADALPGAHRVYPRTK